jgi:hypothetical protein
MKTEKIIANILANKELSKNIAKLNNYSAESFIKDALTYIKATKERRMLCIIESVSASGMSRVIKFHSCQRSQSNYNRARVSPEYYYRNYTCLFLALGYSQAKNTDGFRINGCGMDMVFQTNYSIINDLFRLGVINKETCAKLAQQTPVKL